MSQKNNPPSLVVRKGAFDRFLKEQYGYTDVRQFTAPKVFSSRLNSIFLAKDAEGNDVFIKACRHGDMSENEYRCGLELWKLSPAHFAKPLAYYSGDKFSFCCTEYIPGIELQDAIERGELTGKQKIHIVEELYKIALILTRSNIVHRDIGSKNFLLYGDRVVLIDCQLAIRRDEKKEITLLNNVLKECFWKWEVDDEAILIWDDMWSIVNTINEVGFEYEYKERYDELCSLCQDMIEENYYVSPYPTMEDLNYYIKVAWLLKVFHPKSRRRVRYRRVLEMLRYLKEHHPLNKKENTYTE